MAVAKKPVKKKPAPPKKKPVKKPAPPKKKPVRKRAKKIPQAPWMRTAYQLLGTKEAKGRANNKELMGWAEVVGGKTFRTFTADAIPWCGLFAAYICAQNGIKPPVNPLWARNWATNWALNIEKKSAPPVGTFMTFKRGKGGHIGVLVGMTSSKRGRGYYLILGGNQSDSVTIAAIAKKRCIGWRWPRGMSKFMPKEPAPVMSLKTAKAKISRNEA